MLRKSLVRVFSHRLGGVLFAAVAVVAIGFLLRLVLAITWHGQFSGLANVIYASMWGVLFDLEYAAYAVIPLVLYLALVPQSLFRRPWHRWLTTALFAVILAVLLCSAVAEWLFWDEFGVRFNFIAVDYLIYTTEVVDNLLESYPVSWILAAIAALSIACGLLLGRSRLYGAWLMGETRLSSRWLVALAVALVPVTTTLAFDSRSGPEFANRYDYELSRNGPYLFFAAFRNNELPYREFYLTGDSSSASARVAELTPGSQQAASTLRMPISRDVVSKRAEQRPNVIQITVESLSAEFLGYFGNQEGITPFLDEIAADSLVFTNLLATGTRTVRGMEALTLSIPPSPGRSVVKRPDNAGLFSIGSVFRQKGYKSAFFYGGYGYFDNMNAFFGGNGFEIHDRASEPEDNVDFANAWGVSDEDLYEWVLANAEQAYQQGTPFYDFVMTTSNHRPYTYPEGRIDLPPLSSGRNGAVKYTDYAIHHFIEEARKRPWFDNTIFVIVADHCAASAGKTELPVEKYRIPLLVYAPSLVTPGTVDTLTSQIDVAPTLFGLLNWSYQSEFFGRDVLAESNATQRAFIGTYQSLGLLEDDKLAVLKPVRQSESYCYDRKSAIQRACAADSVVLNDAIAYYQFAAELLERRQRTMGH